MNQPTIQQVPADKIVAGLNDREVFNRTELEALAAHIAEYGLLQPPVFRPVGDGTFQIVAGERRTRAMRDILGWSLIPCLVRTDLENDQDAIGAMGGENRCRAGIEVMSDARSYQRNIDNFGWDVAECARRYGVSTRTVKDRLALLALCEEAQDLVNKGTLTPGYALVLALAGLDRNYQNRALDLLKANRSPNLDWWRGAVAELVLVAGQNSMFDLDAFMSGAVADVQAQNETILPDPDTATAPANGTTAEEILTQQAAWWADLAGQYTARGKKHEARVCRANARNCRQSADLIARFAAMAPAPVVIEPEPWSLPDWATIAVPTAPVPVSDVVAVDPLVGRTRSKCDQCGAKRATHQIARRQATGDGQRKRTVLTVVCNDCLPPGVTSLVGPAPQQLEFVAVAA